MTLSVLYWDPYVLQTRYRLETRNYILCSFSVTGFAFCLHVFVTKSTYFDDVIVIVTLSGCSLHTKNEKD